jgi:hypothetical protein
MGKGGLTRKTRDLDMRHVKITCLSCDLDHEIKIIQ